jgi:hypothetical protein
MLQTARLTVAHLWISVLLLMYMPIPGSSRNVKGNDVALGFGLESCHTFLQARSNSLNFPSRFVALSDVLTLTRYL